MGVDDSDAMLKLAKEDHPEIEFVKGNALDFTLEKKADVIFSNAVFHWLDGEKQQAMLCNLYRNLKPGGELVCEFGGYGCAETVHGALEEIFAEHGLKYPRVFYFPTIGRYAPLLEKAGFKVEFATLFDRPTVQKGENGVADWIRMFDKKPFEGMDGALKDNIITEAQSRVRGKLFVDGQWIVDYVRIRFRASKG